MTTPTTTPRARLAAAEAENRRLARENAMLRAALQCDETARLRAAVEVLQEECRVLRAVNAAWGRKAAER